MGFWRFIKPKVKRKHKWLFARYTEFPTERSDGKWYEAVLFRDEERTEFGITEFIGDHPQNGDFIQHLAKRIVADCEYRRSMLSENKEVKKWWKKH